MKTIIVIPARYQSKRFPGKPLKKILGKELVIWVAEACSSVFGKNFVYIATEDKKIAHKSKDYGFKYVFTSKHCMTGTDRVAEVAKKIKSDIYVNVQGDEPLVKYKDIKKVIKYKLKYPNHIVCGFTKIQKNENPSNKNIPKVVLNGSNELIYISRSLIPGSKNKLKKDKNVFLKQVCIYAFNRKELKQFSSFKRKPLIEKIEDIEILRFFEFNKKIKMVETSSGSAAVDEKNDIKKVENLIKKNFK